MLYIGGQLGLDAEGDQGDDEEDGGVGVLLSCGEAGMCSGRATPQCTSAGGEVWMVVGSGQGGGGMATVPRDRTGGRGGQQRGGMSLGDAGIGVVVLGAATVNVIRVEIVEAGQVRVSMFVFDFMEERLPRGGLVPGGLLPIISHGCGHLRYRCRRRLRRRSREVEGRSRGRVCVCLSVCLRKECGSSRRDDAMGLSSAYHRSGSLGLDGCGGVTDGRMVGWMVGCMGRMTRLHVCLGWRGRSGLRR